MIPASPIGASPVDPQLGSHPAVDESSLSFRAPQADQHFVAQAVHSVRLQFVRSFAAVSEMTAEVFPEARITFETSIDPEIEDDEYFVVCVNLQTTVEDAVARDGEWHKRLRAAAGDAASFFRLHLDLA